VVVQEQEAQPDLHHLEPQHIEIQAAELEVTAHLTVVALEAPPKEVVDIDLQEAAAEVAEELLVEVRAVHQEAQEVVLEVLVVRLDLHQVVLDHLAEEDLLLKEGEDNKPTNLIIY
jgi:hypothetical protein